MTGRSDHDAIMGRISNGLRSIERLKDSDAEDAQGTEYELWRGVLLYYALGGTGPEAALEVMKSRDIDFPRWLP